MAVLIEGTSVIIKVGEIQRRITGGWTGFMEYVPNETLCSDNEIARVGFMTPDDVKHFINRLESLGFIFQADGEAQDIAVADQIHGVSTKCSWLEFGHINWNNNPKQRIAACRLVGSVEDHIYTPDGWAYENSLSASYGFVPVGQEDKSLKYLRHEHGLDVYLNELTGEEVFIGRTGQS